MNTTARQHLIAAILDEALPRTAEESIDQEAVIRRAWMYRPPGRGHPSPFRQVRDALAAIATLTDLDDEVYDSGHIAAMAIRSLQIQQETDHKTIRHLQYDVAALTAQTLALRQFLFDLHDTHIRMVPGGNECTICREITPNRTKERHGEGCLVGKAREHLDQLTFLVE